LPEESLTLACPEAARLVLLAGELRCQSSGGHYQFLWDDEKTQGEPIHAWFWPIREFSVRLLTYRRYPLWQRLFLLGLFARRLDGITADAERAAGAASATNAERTAEATSATGLKNASRFENASSAGRATGAEKTASAARAGNLSTQSFGRFLQAFQGAVQHGALRGEMEKIAPNPALQLQLVWQFLALRLRDRNTSARMAELTKKFERGIKSDETFEARSEDGSAAAALTRNYAENNSLFLKPLMNLHPGFLENYVLNQVFRTLFPFGPDALNQDSLPAVRAGALTNQDGNGQRGLHGSSQSGLHERGQSGSLSATRSFLQLATQFALVKGVLIGLAGYHRENLSLAHCVAAVQIISRDFDHSQHFLNNSYELLRRSGHDTPSGFAALLRDS
jgi:lysine-N-methylase